MENIIAKRKRENHKEGESGETGKTSELPAKFLKASTADHQAEIGAHKQVESCEIGNTSEQSETFLKMLAAKHQAGVRGDHKQVESGETENTSDQLETVVVIAPGIILAEIGAHKQVESCEIGNTSEQSETVLNMLAAKHKAEIGAHKQVESCEIGNTSEQSETVLNMLAAKHQAEIGAHKQVESCEIGNTSEQSETVLKMLAAEHQAEIGAHKQVESCEIGDISELSETVLKMLVAEHQAEIGAHKQVGSCEIGNISELSETFLNMLVAEHQGTKIKENREGSSGDCNGKPPRLCFKLPKTSDLPSTSIAWCKVQLPIDVLVLTVEDCEFLGCYSYLDKPFKAYHKEIGPVYFGSIGNDDQEKLKVALMKYGKGSVAPGGPLPVVKNASRVLGPKAVISVGTCRSLNSEKIKIGDIVVSSKLTTPAFRIPASRNIGNLIRHASDGWKAPLEMPDEWQVQVHFDADMQSQGQYEDEGIIAAAYDVNVEWLIVKGVASDRGLSQSLIDDWKSFASTIAASLVANILSDSVVFQEWPHCSQAETGEDHKQVESCETRSEQPETVLKASTADHQDGFGVAKHIDQLRRLYDTREGCLALFPWCEGEFNFRLSDIFTRLRMVSREKTRGTATDKTVDMSAIFQPHEGCQNPRAVLIEGDPGMGKTTYCHKLAFEWATKEPDAGDYFPNFKVVILLRCRDMSSNSNLRDAICEQILPVDIEEQDEKVFFNFITQNQSDVLLVLDGFDELPKDRWSEVEQVIQGRSGMFCKCPLVVTARHEAGIRLRKSCDTLLQIVGFDLHDAYVFMVKFFKPNEEKGEEIREKLFDRLEEDKSLAELIANPLNAALLCLLCEYSDGKLPEKKTTLYMYMVEYILTRYTEKKKSRLETDQDLTKVYEQQLKHLGSIALEGLFKQMMYFEKHQLGSHEDELPAFGFLSVQPGRNRRKPCLYYAFMHKSFQEYFAAFYICCQLLSGEMSPEDLVAVERYFSELNQVLFFTCGMLAEKSEDKAMALIKSLAAHTNEDEGSLEGYTNQDEDEESLESFTDEDEEEDIKNLRFLVAVHCIKECKKEGSNFHLDLARTFGKSVRLQSVNASDTDLGYADCDIITKILAVNTTVTNLYLTANNLDSKNADKLCEMLYHNKTLTNLDLSLNQLDSEDVGKICEVLRHNKTLTNLNLSNNELGSECADKICEVLRHNKTLTSLDLSANKLGSEDADKICKALYKNKTLKWLDLSGNIISNPVCKKLKEEHGEHICNRVTF